MTLKKEQLEHFKEEGYVVLEAALQDVDFEPVIQDYEGVIDKLAKDLHTEGRISQLYADEPFETRLARICDEDEATYFESDTFLDVGHIRGKGTFHFMRNKRLLDLIEGLIGPEICCSPMTHIRAKLPSNLEQGRNSNVVFWHQDAIFFHEEADTTFVLTVWIPLCDTTEENGCLRVMPRIHKHRTVYWGDSLPDGDWVSVPMKKRDVIFIHKLTPIRRVRITQMRSVGAWIYATRKEVRPRVAPFGPVLMPGAAFPGFRNRLRGVAGGLDRSTRKVSDKSPP